MKNILIALFALVSFGAFGSDFQAQSLLNGSDVYVVDNTTKSFGDTNVYYLRPNGQYAYSFTSTNIILDVTNAVSGAGTNRTVVNTNIVNGGAFASSASVGHNFDGTPNSNASFQLRCKTFGTTASTNALTVTLERTADGVGWDSVHTFAFAYTANTNDTRSVITNLPSTFLTGTKAIRIKSIAADDNASNGTNIIQGASLNIWVP